jgi:hypothetical protein
LDSDLDAKTVPGTTALIERRAKQNDIGCGFDLNEITAWILA